jgi:hypothetical protein
MMKNKSYRRTVIKLLIKVYHLLKKKAQGKVDFSHLHPDILVP